MKLISLIGALVGSMSAIAQEPNSNRTIFIKPDWTDYLPVFGAGMILGFIICFLYRWTADRRFWKGIDLDLD
jgi:ABC-type antimicrobial peptide transport system permease subunit